MMTLSLLPLTTQAAKAAMAWCASGSESLLKGYVTHVEAGSFVRRNQPEDPA